MKSPCARCAGTANGLTVICTQGLIVLPVRWQMVMRPLVAAGVAVGVPHVAPEQGVAVAVGVGSGGHGRRGLDRKSPCAR
jgi:hypothetical protein